MIQEFSTGTVSCILLPRMQGVQMEAGKGNSLMNRLEKILHLSKIFYHYKNRSVQLPYMPIRMWVESTNSCNLRCSVCPNSSDTTSPRGNMEMSLFRKIIQEASGRVNDLNISHRGEPLFNPDLEEMIVLARSNGMGTRIHTNATMLDADRAVSLLESRPDLVSFSFDGYDKESYESVRVGGTFETTLANIRGFLSEKRRRGLARPYTVIQIIEPWDVTPEYRERLLAFGRQFREAGLDKFYVKRPHNWAGNAPGQIDLAQSYIPCTFLFYSMTVLWDGTVCPCPQDWYGTLPLGNLKNQTIEEIWNGEGMRDLRKRMHRCDLSGLLCQNCDRVYGKKNIMGVPTENIKAFLGETLAGYEFVGKIIRR